MRNVTHRVLSTFVAVGLIASVLACTKKPGGGAVPPGRVAVTADDVQKVMDDLRPWIDPEKLDAAEHQSLEGFCRFLAVRRGYDQLLGQQTNEAQFKAIEEEALEQTQPLIDDLAGNSKPTEAVLMKVLEARKDLSPDKRQQTLLRDDPEVFAAVVLWKVRSTAAVPLLMEMAQNKAFSDRAVFVRALGRIGDPKALDLLKELAEKDGNAEVREEAKTAIEAIQKAQPTK